MVSRVTFLSRLKNSIHARTIDSLSMRAEGIYYWAMPSLLSRFVSFFFCLFESLLSRSTEK